MGWQDDFAIVFKFWQKLYIQKEPFLIMVALQITSYAFQNMDVCLRRYFTADVNKLHCRGILCSWTAVIHYAVIMKKLQQICWLHEILGFKTLKQNKPISHTDLCPSHEMVTFSANVCHNTRAMQTISQFSIINPPPSYLNYASLCCSAVVH